MLPRTESFAIILLILVTASLSSCKTISKPDYAVPDLPPDQLAKIEGSRYLLSSPQLRSKNVRINSINNMRVNAYATESAPGEHEIEILIYWGGAAGPEAERRSETATFTLAIEPGQRYKIDAATGGGNIFGVGASRYWWVENLNTGEIVAGERPGTD